MTSESERSLSEWLSLLEMRHPRAIDMGLERVGAVAARLGVDQVSAKVVTVAGTNGKGSTVVTIDAVLSAAGYRVGRYMSPHLHHFNERIVIGGGEISDEELVRAFAEVETARGDISLTYFEFTTLAALWLFKTHSVDVMVLEVGLGGRLDAVNVLDPDVAVITSIGIDHVDWLGADRESIGREKAGILREGRSAICGDDDPPVTLLALAETLHVPLLVKGRDYHYQLQEKDWTLQGAGFQWDHLPAPRVALSNASTALMAIKSLGLAVSPEAIHQGLRQAVLAGRFEQVGERPAILLDVAHNPHGARFLSGQLISWKVKHPGKIRAVFGMLMDKDVVATIQEMLPWVDIWYPASLPPPRGESAQRLQQRLLDSGGVVEGIYASPTQALEEARRQAGAQDTILVFGSFYTVGAVSQCVRPVEGE